MHSDPYKRICLEIQKGKLALVIEDLRRESIILSDNEYFKLVSYLHSSIQKKVNFDVADLATTLVILTSNIKPSDAEQQYKYVVHYYHIFKHLFEQKAYNEILQAKECLYPHWLSLNDNQIVIYESLQILIHNHIFTNSSSNLFTPFLFLWLHISKRVNHKQPAGFYQNLNKYLSLLKVTDLIKTLDEIFAFINDFPCHEQFYLDIMKLLIVIVTLLCQKFDGLSNTHSYIIKYFNYIENFIEPVIQDTEKLLYFRWFKKVFKMLFYKPNSFLGKEMDSTLQEFENFNGNAEGIVLIVCEMFKLYSDNIKYDENYFNTIFNVESLMALFKFLNKLGLVVSKFKLNKQHSDECKCVYDKFNASRVTSTVGLFLYQAIRNNIQSEFDLLEINNIFENNFQYIEYIKANGCNSWKGFWKEIGIYIYNVSILLKGHNAVTMSQLFVKSCIRFEGVRNCEIFEDALQRSLQNLSSNCSAVDEHLDALKWSTVALFLNPQMTNKCAEIWCRVKYKTKVDPVASKLTVRGVLRKNSDELRPLLGEEESSSLASLTAAIVIEIKAYIKYWPNRIALELALTDLFKISNDLRLKGEMVSLLCTYRLPNVTDFLIMSLKTLLREYKGLLSKKSKQGCLWYEKIILGHLYLFDYRFKRQKMLMENEDDMVQMEKLTKKMSETTLSASKNKDVNPNDECDLVPSYKQLKLDKNMNLLSLLKIAVSFWKTSLDDLKIDESESKNMAARDALKKLNTLCCLEGIAYEYRLNNHTCFALDTWQLLLQISRILESPSYVLKSIGHILEIIDNDEDEKSFQIEAQAIIEKETEEEQSAIFEATVIYHMGKSLYNYRKRAFKQGYQDYANAETVFKKIENKNGNLLQLEARLICLKARFLDLPCSYQIADHSNAFVPQIAHEALLLINQYFQVHHATWSADTESATLLLEMALFAGIKYKMMLKPRETRCYLRSYTVLSQKQLLPLTTAHLLVTLAFADILSLRLDDCATKLEGIADILCIPPSSLMAVDTDPSSPALNKHPHFSMPSFIQHKHPCDCFKCQSIDYWSILFQKMHLEANLLMYRKDFRNSHEHFKGTYDFYQCLMRKDISASLAINVESYFCGNNIYPAFLLSYILLSVKMEQISVAKDLNQEMRSLFVAEKCIDSQIFKEFILNSLKLSNPQVRPQEIDAKPDDEAQVQAANIVKTPESKYSEIVEISHQQDVPVAGDELKPKRFPRPRIIFPAQDMNESEPKENARKCRQKSAAKPKEVLLVKSSGSDRLLKVEKENSSLKVNKLSSATATTRSRKKKQ